MHLQNPQGENRKIGIANVRMSPADFTRAFAMTLELSTFLYNSVGDHRLEEIQTLSFLGGDFNYLCVHPEDWGRLFFKC